MGHRSRRSSSSRSSSSSSSSSSSGSEKNKHKSKNHSASKKERHNQDHHSHGSAEHVHSGTAFFPMPQVAATTAMFSHDHIDNAGQMPMPMPRLGGTSAHPQPQPFQPPRAPPSGYRIPLTTEKPFPPSQQAGEPPCYDLNGSPVYFGSAIFENSVHPCKVCPHLYPTARVPYAGKEYEHQGRYDLLPFTNDMELIPASLGTIPTGRRPVEGGYENGMKLYHAVGKIDDVSVPGKCGEHLSGANIPFGGEERYLRDYMLLVWRN